ncbi:MAG: DUF4388 domain-containing protein [Candidatus Dormibacteria bacterium]
MQNQGSLGPTTVAELLQTMQQERATGTLVVESGGQTCSLHFLFGHLFHAVGDSQEGDQAVLSALGWSSGLYNFNPRAKLPPEETINSSTEDLVARWESEPDKPATAPAEPVGVGKELSPASGYSSAGPPPGPATDGGREWLDPLASRPMSEPEEEMSDIPPFQAPVPAFRQPLSATAGSGLGPTPSTPPPAPRAAMVPGAIPPQRPGGPSTVRPPVRPGPSGPPPKPVAGATRAQLSILVPMPGGPSLHSGLKASFLNFPMLLKTLSQDGFSGYVSVTGEGDNRSRAHILFREGDLLQAQQRADGNYRRGKTAIQEVVRTVSLGQGLIDAVELPSELVVSVASLIVASTAFVNLPARIIDFDALLEYIEDQHLGGGILVSQGDQVAVALVTEGTVKGSYSSSAPELTEGSQVASAACTEREARIDVVSVPPQALTAIDLSEIG